MSELPLWGYAVIFAASSLLSAVLVPVALRVATGKGILDRPTGYKAQTSPVPYLGGTAIVIAFAAVVVGAAVIRPPVAGLGELAMICGLGVFLSLVGLLDDLRGLGPLVRVAAVIAAAAALLVTGVGVRLVDGGIVDATITVLWVAGIANAFNLLDNMDGLCAGIATIASLWLLVIAALNGQFLVAALAAALAGCAVGFLRHNRYPARIYMGDAGSLFLGFVLSVLALKLRFEAPREITVFVPIVVLALPILDTSLVTVTRLLHRRNPLTGGRDHLSHRLVFLGLSVPTAVRVLYAVAILLGWAGLVMSRLDAATAYMLVGLVFTVLIVGGVLLGRVPVYASSKRRRMMFLEVDRHDEDYGHEAGEPRPRVASTVESR